MNMQKSYHHSCSSVPYVYNTYWGLLDKHCDSCPDREAVIFYDKDICYFRATFRQLRDKSYAIAAALVKKYPWLKFEDRLGVVGSNSPQVFLTELAAYLLGLTILFLPTGIKGDIIHTLNLTKCVGLVFESSCITSDEIDEIYASVQTLKFSVNYGESKESNTNKHEALSWDELADSISLNTENYAEVSDRCSRVMPEMEAVVYFTSGTTGKPKAAVWSHFGLVNNGVIFGEMNNINYSTKYLQDRPIISGAGAAFSTRLVAACGATSVIMKTNNILGDATNIHHLYNIIQKEQVNHMLMMGYVMHDLVRCGEAEGKLATLKVANVAGQILNTEHAAILNRRFPDLRIIDVYGSTEMQVALMQIQTTTLGFTGKPLRHLEVKVANKEGETVDLGEAGELWLRSAVCMLGYITPTGTDSARDSCGWYHTRDGAVMNQKGEVKILGRMTELIRRGGSFVFHGVLESKISEHEKVKEIQVVGVSDDRLYQEVCACIVPSDLSLTEKELIQWCQEQIKEPSTNVVVPKYYYFLERLPITSSGKIDRKKLTEMAESFVHKS